VSGGSGGGGGGARGASGSGSRGGRGAGGGRNGNNSRRQTPADAYVKSKAPPTTANNSGDERRDVASALLAMANGPPAPRNGSIRSSAVSVKGAAPSPAASAAGPVGSSIPATETKGTTVSAAQP
ncbi:unnamed protein product, partial [Laminaria digitata]